MKRLTPIMLAGWVAALLLFLAGMHMLNPARAEIVDYRQLLTQRSLIQNPALPWLLLVVLLLAPVYIARTSRRARVLLVMLFVNLCAFSNYMLAYGFSPVFTHLHRLEHDGVVYNVTAWHTTDWEYIDQDVVLYECDTAETRCRELYANLQWIPYQPGYAPAVELRPRPNDELHLYVDGELVYVLPEAR